MRVVLEQVPVQASIVIPFGSLRELAAHEHQLLAWVRVHVRIQQPQIGKLLPLATGHLLQERSLTVHDLVV